MNTVLEKGNIIAKIRRGEDLNQIIDYVKSEIYQNGPRSSVVLEICHGEHLRQLPVSVGGIQAEVHWADHDQQIPGAFCGGH